MDEILKNNTEFNTFVEKCKNDFPQPRRKKKNKLDVIINFKRKHPNDFLELITSSEECIKLINYFTCLSTVQKSNLRKQLRDKKIFTDDEILFILPKKQRRKNNYFEDLTEFMITMKDINISKYDYYELRKIFQNLSIGDYQDIQLFLNDRYDNNQEKLYRRILQLIKYLKKYNVDREKINKLLV